MLKGQELLNAVSLYTQQGLSRTDMALKCGYFKVEGNNTKVLFTAFYEAIMDAKGIITAQVEKDTLIEEYPDNDTFEQLIEDGYDVDAIKAFIELYGEEELQHFDESYQGEMSGAEFAEQLTTDCYALDIPAFVCVDWNATWEQLSYDYDEQDGYIFSRNFWLIQ